MRHGAEDAGQGQETRGYRRHGTRAYEQRLSAILEYTACLFPVHVKF